MGLLFASVWLVFLVPALQDAWRDRDSLRGWIGILALVGFAATYVLAFALTRRRRAAASSSRLLSA